MPQDNAAALPPIVQLSSPIQVRRTLDAAAINEIANHPEVRPWLGGDGVLDLSELVSAPANITLAIDGGAFVCVCRDACSAAIRVRAQRQSR